MYKIEKYFPNVHLFSIWEIGKEEKVMKQAWKNIKSFVTVAFTFTIVILMFITVIKGNWDMFQQVFALFNSLAIAVFTYFFSKKSNTFYKI